MTLKDLSEYRPQRPLRIPLLRHIPLEDTGIPQNPILPLQSSYQGGPSRPYVQHSKEREGPVKIRNLATPRATEPHILSMHLIFLELPVRTVHRVLRFKLLDSATQHQWQEYEFL